MKHEFLKSKLALILTAVLVMFCVGCFTYRVEIDETSKGTITIKKTIKLPKFQARADMVVPSWPFIPDYLHGLPIAKGSYIEINIPAGTYVVFTDKIEATGDVVESEEGVTRVEGVIEGDSNYAWTMPELLGPEHAAVVEVTGTFAIEVYSDMVNQNADSDGWQIPPGSVKSFSYKVTGPAPIWEIPITYEDGSVDMMPLIFPYRMVYESAGSLEAVSGYATSASADEDDSRLSFQFSGGFPVRLVMEDQTAEGSNIIAGNVLLSR